MSASDRTPWIYDQTHERDIENVESLIRLALSQEKGVYSSIALLRTGMKE